MKLTILGNRGPLPLPGEACSSYLLEHEGHALLIDAGSASLPRLLEHVSLKELDAVILSHLHFDHCSDALVMQYSTKTAPLPLYCPFEPAPVLDALTGFGGFEAHEAAEGKTVAIGPFTVTFGPAKHPVPCVSVKVEAGGRIFAYTGDSNDCPEQVDFLHGADLLLADAGMTESAWTAASPHRTPKMCAELAEKSGAGCLVLSHFGPAQDPGSCAKEAAGSVLVSGAEVNRVFEV